MNRRTVSDRADRCGGRAVRLGLSCVLATIAVACGNDRPGVSEWADAWESVRVLVPTMEEFEAGGQDLCDRLVGDLRLRSGELTPTPAEALDGAVRSWIDEAESIAFDCPSDPDALAGRLDELDVLAAEIDAGVAAERD